MHKIKDTQLNRTIIHAKVTPNGVGVDHYEYEHIRVRLIRYKAGTEIPVHCHKTEALHIVIKGKAQLQGCDMFFSELESYISGDFAYGPLQVIEDLEMLVIEPFWHQ